MAAADFDRDGDVDILVNNYRSQAALYDNQTAGKADSPNFLAVRLRGTHSNRDAIGAELTVITSDGQQRRRLVSAGQSYASQFSLEQVVGLGAATEVQALNVRWPNGAEESFGAAKAGQRLHLVEGEGSAIVSEPKRGGTESSSGPWWAIVLAVVSVVTLAAARTLLRRARRRV